jgi:hypothetical protein
MENGISQQTAKRALLGATLDWMHDASSIGFSLERGTNRPLCGIWANRKSFLLAPRRHASQSGRYPVRIRAALYGRLRSQRATRPVNRPLVRVSGGKKYTITRTYKNNLRFLADIAWHRNLEGQSVSHAFRIRVQVRRTSDQSLQRTSVYRQPRDRAAPEPRSVRPSACQFFVLCCVFE